MERLHDDQMVIPPNHDGCERLAKEKSAIDGLMLRDQSLLGGVSRSSSSLGVVLAQGFSEKRLRSIGESEMVAGRAEDELEVDCQQSSCLLGIRYV